MNRLLKGSCLLLLLFAIACTKIKPPVATLPTNQLGYDTTTSQTVSYFNHITVIGNLNMVINSGVNKQQVTLAGNSVDLQHVSVKVFNETLYIQVANGFPRIHGITATINTHYLNSVIFNGQGNITAHRVHTAILDLILNNHGVVTFDGRIGLRRLVVNGNSTITIQGIDSRSLNITMHGGPRLMLSGTANLKTINAVGTGSLNFYWVASHELLVNARGCSAIQLAGIVDTLCLQLHDAARFDGKYLRAQNVYVKTYDTSFAQIYVLKSQNVLASDHSNVYFYNHPQYSTNFMAYGGAALDANLAW